MLFVIFLIFIVYLFLFLFVGVCFVIVFIRRWVRGVWVRVCVGVGSGWYIWKLNSKIRV